MLPKAQSSAPLTPTQSRLRGRAPPTGGPFCGTGKAGGMGRAVSVLWPHSSQNQPGLRGQGQEATQKLPTGRQPASLPSQLFPTPLPIKMQQYLQPNQKPIHTPSVTGGPD